jgi:predicted metal-dependent phosphoesterase TrpH
MAVETVTDALSAEGITQPVALPAQYTQTPGTALLEARRLNTRKIAVVHVGTRPAPDGSTQTFMKVERLVQPAKQN